MSLEQAVKELNENIVKLNKTLEVYPSPVDNLVDSTQVDNAVKAQEAASEPEPKVETAPEAKYNADDLAKIAQKAIQANKTENAPKIKQKMKALNAEKVTLTPPEHIDEMYEFLESLV